MAMGIFASGMGVYIPLRAVDIKIRIRNAMITAITIDPLFWGIKSIPIRAAERSTMQMIMNFGVFHLSSSIPPTPTTQRRTIHLFMMAKEVAKATLVPNTPLR